VDGTSALKTHGCCGDCVETPGLRIAGSETLGMRLHRLARLDLALFLVAALIVLCASSFLTGAYIASNSLEFQNCFTAGTPCMDLGGEQRSP
jgi:hypothetical protein